MRCQPYPASACEVDQAREISRKRTAKIGTTGRGIGPAYEDKVARRGIRLSDLRNPQLLVERLEALAAHHNVWLQAAGQPAVNAIWPAI